MTTLLSLIRKEALHIVRDRRTMLVTILIPLMLLLLFGFAISTEVNSVRVVAVVENHTDATRRILEQLSVNDYFDFRGLTTADRIDELMRRGEADIALVMRTDSEGRLTSQIIADASNPPVAQATTAYVRSVVDPSQSDMLITHTLYNPQMKSAFNFVPGIMGMIFMLICAMMTSVSIVGEKETGTMDLLLVSPARPGMIIFGKLIPYFLVSCIILAIMLTIAYTVLGLPFSSGVVRVVLVSLLYVALSLSIGLLVSAMVDNGIAALIVSGVVFMVPVLMLSGMIFPIDNMPRVLQWLSAIIPARWYIAAMRKLMIQQLDFSYVVTETAVLAAMTVMILAVAIRKFNASTSGK